MEVPPPPCHHMSLMDFVVSPPGCGRSVTDFWGWDAHEAHYVVPMRWMVIYENEVPVGALNLNSTKLTRPWSPKGSFSSRKNPDGRTGNRTRDLMISSQKLRLLDHEAGLSKGSYIYFFQWRYHPARYSSVNVLHVYSGATGSYVYRTYFPSLFGRIPGYL
jgi:hypothetical protein